MTFADDRQNKDIDFDPARADECPHAKAANDAARKADMARKAGGKTAAFDYQGFYQNELDKKHKDK